MYTFFINEKLVDMLSGNTTYLICISIDSMQDKDGLVGGCSSCQEAGDECGKLHCCLC